MEIVQAEECKHETIKLDRTAQLWYCLVCDAWILDLPERLAHRKSIRKEFLK